MQTNKNDLPVIKVEFDNSIDDLIRIATEAKEKGAKRYSVVTDLFQDKSYGISSPEMINKPGIVFFEKLNTVYI